MSMRNLYEETLEILEHHGKTFDNIEFFTNGEWDVSVDDFIAYAKDFNYDAGYGVNYVNANLIGIGDGFLLIRRTYDGAEWWDYYNIAMRVTAANPEFILFSLEGMYEFRKPISDDEENDIINAWGEYNPC